ncbi:MAG: autotransporter-associated beta strand repeat-containing protein, partial [Novosphingobium sp.]
GDLGILSGGIRLTNVNAGGSGNTIRAMNPGTFGLELDIAADGTLSNNIGSGIALTKTGTGTVTLTGTNTYGGGTTINAGAIRVDDFARLGTGGVTAAAGGSLILDYNGAGQLLQSTPFMTGAGSFIKEGTGDVVMNQTSTYTGGTTIRAGRIGLNNGDALGTGNIQVDSGATLGIGGITLANSVSGSGSIVKTANNQATLGGNNSAFTGLFDIQNGSVVLNDGRSAGSGTVAIAAGSFIDVDSTVGDTTIAASLSGAGDLGIISANRVRLTGSNTLSGVVFVDAGTLQIEGSQNIGTANITLSGASGVLDLSTAQSTTLANAVAGVGRVVKTGTGTVFMTGANTHAGGTDIQQGTLVVNSPAALGTGGVSIASGALLGVTYNGASNIAMSNALTGAGGLVKDGTGALIINTPANTFSGGTTINAGRIGLNFGNGLGTGGVAIASGAELAIGSVAFNNSVSGAGRIVKTSAGAATLGGTNTHSGGLDIQGGSVAVNSSAPLGTGGVTIASGASLIYTNSAAASFANGLSGAGTFEKLGAGQLSFANTFTIGALTLSAGRTRINTVATTSAAVASGATLDGTGRIIGNVTNNGTVAPGNSIGTLTVQGNYVHNANGVLEIEFDAGGNIDLLDVTGNATLNGGTIRFVSVGGAEGQGGTFLRTGGTLTGTFAAVETVGALLPLSVVYEPNRAFMAPSVLTARPSTFNAQSLAAADTALGFVDAIGAANVGQPQGNRLWLNGLAAWGQRSASGTTLAYDHDTRGISGGANFAVGDAITVGLAMGWAKGDITLGSNGGGGDQSSLLGSLHARYSGTGFTLGGGLLYGKVDQNTLRNVSFNGFSGSVAGETESSLLGGFAELGLPLGSTGGWAFSANLRGSYLRQKQDGYTESGSSPLRLKLGELATSTIEGQAGFTAKTSLWNRANGGEETSEGIDLRIELGGRYMGTIGDRAIPVTFAVSNAGIVLQGDNRNTLQGRFGLGLDYTIGSGATFSLGYRGEVGKTDRHAVMAGASVRF